MGEHDQTLPPGQSLPGDPPVGHRAPVPLQEKGSSPEAKPQGLGSGQGPLRRGRRFPGSGGQSAQRVPTARVPVKETSASLSCPSSGTLSLSDLEPPRARFMFRKYWPQRCRPASFLSLFSLARRFWNHTWRGRAMSGRCSGTRGGPCLPAARRARGAPGR